MGDILDQIDTSACDSASPAAPAARAEAPIPAEAPILTEPKDFIRAIVAESVRSGQYGGRVATRFPPEPNGYLHIGHAKSICLNFGVAREFGGETHLRFDDTNPETEDPEYVQSIMDDVRWLGFDWGSNLFYASDYSEQLYQFAEQLILQGDAYVDDLSEQEIREWRGTVMEPGRNSPWRDRPVEENLDLFRRMRAGEFPDGARVLRGKCDMASTNMKMRDPLLYRIRHATHYRTGDAWCIYPFYDYAHPLSDQIERITHSICTLEFENNRDIYDWLLDALFPEPRSHQYEFARLSLDYTVMSKRKLLQLVEEKKVAGWDDPRLPTIAGLRRRGVRPEAIRDFADRIGVAKANSRVEMGLLESCIRDDLNPIAPRVLAVLRPLKVVVDNFPADTVEWLDAPYFPHDVGKEGSRRVPFSRELYIEQSDYMENPPRDFYRMAPGREVRLRHAWIVTCTGAVKDADGNVVEVHCTYDPATRSGSTSGDGKRKTQTAIQWVSAAHALPAEVRLYDRLLRVPDPDAEGLDFKDALNSDSLEVISGALVEPSIADDLADTRYQFERHGYFWRDSADSAAGALVFNRIIGLRDSWAKQVTPAKADPVNKGRPVDKGSPKGKGKEPLAQEPHTEGKPRIPERSPELMQRWQEFVQEYALTSDEAELLTRDESTADFYAAAVAAHANRKAAANWISHDLLPILRGRAPSELPLTPQALASLLEMVDAGTISTAAARTIFAELVEKGGDPARIVEELGLAQMDDADALTPIVERVIAANPEKVDQYRAGKTGLLGFFVGQVMKETRGAANAQAVQELLVQALDLS